MDRLWAPWRAPYIRKIGKTKGCVFCRANKMKPGFESLCLVKTKFSMVVLNKFPYNSGHILILPRRHVATLAGLTKAESVDLHELLRKATLVLEQAYKPGGLNVGLNMGAVAGAGIPGHLHYHVIPRWAGDLNFFPLIAETKAVIESLEMTFDRLVPYFL